MQEIERRKKYRLSWRRLSLGFALAGFTGLLVFLTVFFDTGKVPHLQLIAPPTDFVDMYLDNVVTTQYDDTGKLEQRFSADAVRHFRHSGNSEIKQPRFSFLDPNQRDWHARADVGALNAAGTEMLLSGGVLIYTDGETHTLRTEQLTLLPEEKIARTDRPVIFRAPEGVTEAIGMTAELAVDRIHLHQNVRGRYDIQP